MLRQKDETVWENIRIRCFLASEEAPYIRFNLIY